MEDASKEFQVFLSPMRNYQQPYREASAKHRIVPVISKIFSTSSSSTFALNQRKSNVYKAMSGVSFQDTDVAEKKHVTKKEKRTNRRERKETYPGHVADNEKKQVIPVIPGARRSRSLTSMESDTTISTDYTKNPPEIMHPFSPIILYNNGSGSRRSRYSRVKEKRRASSQVRNSVDVKKQDATLFTKHEQPVRPRRARSASRSRKSIILASYSSENNLDNPRLAPEDIFHLRCEKQSRKNSTSKVNSAEKTHIEIDASTSTAEKNISMLNHNSKDVDFSVNDTDWKKYDALVTKKLDALLQGKEEPEGGYFSLEREESEEVEISSEIGEHFQRDNCSESIYVTQVFENVSKDKKLFTKHENFIVEELYSEVSTHNEGQEVGYLDDEGLYEEIFYDNKNDTQPVSLFNNESYGVNSGINLTVSPQTNETEGYVNSFVDISFPKIEKNSSSTIVYIGGHNDDCKLNSISQKLSKSCSNVSSNIINQIIDKELNKYDAAHNLIKESSFACGEKRQTNHSAWCGCCHGKSVENHSVSHTSSCIQSKSGLLSSKYSFMGDNPTTHSEGDCTKGTTSLNKETAQSCSDFGGQIRSKSIERDLTPRTQEVTRNKQSPLDYELSDIDLEMFAPKNLNDKEFFNLKNHPRSVSDVHLNLGSSRFYLNEGLLSNRVIEIEQKNEIKSPKTFKAFLEDSIFNPPDNESVVDEADTLVIKSDQTITCITDSSSSSSEDDADDTDTDAGDQDASWLEAKSEFEFVACKEEKKKFLNFAKRKKSKSIISIQKLFSSSLSSSISSSSLSQLDKTNLPTYISDSKEVPARPSRRRKKSQTVRKDQT